MTQSELITRVQRGDEPSIATLLTQALPGRSIQVTVRLRQGCLQVILKSPKPLDRLKTNQAIQQALLQAVAPVKTIAVYLLLPGRDAPAWSETFSLRANLAKMARSSHSAKSRKPSTLPQWLTEKPDPAALIARLDPVKLGVLVPLMLYGIFVSPAYNADNFVEGTNGIMMFLHGVNLIFHEAGHTLFAPFGQFLHLLGGSLNQILIPGVVAGYFFYTQQRFASAVTACWMAENFWDVSIYIKDAQERELPLLGGEGVLHDWHYLLLDMNLLPYDDAVGNMVYAIGSLLYLAAILLGIYFAQKTKKPASD